MKENAPCWLVSTDSDGNQSRVPIKAGQTVLGREFPTRLQDKRLSRKQAVIEVKDTKITLTRLGINPVRLIGSDGTKRDLFKDVPYLLANNDRFTLLADEYPFSVEIAAAAASLLPRATPGDGALASAGAKVVADMARVQRGETLPPPLAAAAAAAANKPAKGVPALAVTPAAAQPPKKSGTKRPAEHERDEPAAAAAADGGDDERRRGGDGAAKSKRLEVPGAAAGRALGGGEPVPVSAAMLAAAAPLKASGPSIAGPRWLALPLLGTLSGRVEANVSPDAAVRAFAAAARALLQRRLDDAALKLVLLVPRDSAELRALDALDEPLGPRVQLVRVADRAAVADAAVRLHTAHSLGCRYLCNEATWRLKGNGAPLNRAVFEAAGEDFAARVHKVHPMPAEVGSVVACEVPPTAPLRRNEGVQHVLHVVTPIVDPDDRDHVPADHAAKVLLKAYNQLFAKFEALLASNRE